MKWGQVSAATAHDVPLAGFDRLAQLLGQFRIVLLNPLTQNRPATSAEERLTDQADDREL
jgi:hypothetical protein